MREENPVDSLTNYTYLQYLEDKEECSKEMGVLLQAFRSKYEISFHSLEFKVEASPTFGDENIIDSVNVNIFVK